MSTSQPLMVPEGHGDMLWYDGGLLRILASGAQTGGAFLLLEAHLPQGKTTPLHVHEEEHETFYVLEGELLTEVAGVRRTVGPGTMFSIPPGTPHAFLVVSQTARWLTTVTPAGRVMEGFLKDVGVPARAPTLPPEGAFDLEQTLAAARRHGLTILGPPPFSPESMTHSARGE